VSCFTSYRSAVDKLDLPLRFTFPFYYEPHPLAIKAAEELQEHLQTQKEWQHDFNQVGKMFGVLVVQKANGELGYLSAFSGKLADSNHLPGFVPPVYDMLDQASFFPEGQEQLNQLNRAVKELSADPTAKAALDQLQSDKKQSVEEIKAQKAKMKAGKEERKAIRDQARIDLEEEDARAVREELNQESIREKLQLRDLSLFWKEQVEKSQAAADKYAAAIQQLKEERKALSASLQRQLFESYHFLNSNGEEQSLIDIFKDLPSLPAAAGECAAPKLLQYAFEHNLKPIVMAEFWWGKSPQSEIRQHGHYYPSCQGKCKPILGHMLKGMEVDDNPMLINPGIGKELTVIHEEESFLVLHKPAGMLSVPGINIKDSVYSRMLERYPKATGPLVVHRLDMATSGLMLIAKTKDTHKALQRQFIKRSIKKRYVALLDGIIEEDEGVIDLPLRVDLDDRPRQVVCYEHGKSGRTLWKVIERKEGQTRIHFHPITGRTHQLRVHSAHAKGLNTPILGDDLYGSKKDRLHLHAERLELQHPITREELSFEVAAEF
jgi:tRNA pseudouridine32 synthase / 23S rRNA pseudouridine746 synthase